MHSPQPKPSRQLMCKRNGKKKMPEYDTDTGVSDQSDSEMVGREDGPLVKRS